MTNPLVEAWLHLFGDVSARRYLLEYDPKPANDHLNYDGIECARRMSELMAGRDAEVSAALWTAAESMMADMWTYSGMDAGPDEAGLGAPGYYNYNIGPRRMIDDSRSNPSLLDNYGRIACNFARGSSFSTPVFSMQARSFDPVYIWPYADGDGRWDPSMPPVNARQQALAVLSHIMTDDIYDTYEDRTLFGFTYFEGHRWFITDILGRWFFQYNMDTGEDLPYIACIDQWRNIDQDIQDAGGDLTQVPKCWSPSPSTFSPFTFVHVARMLIRAYDFPLIVNHPYGGTIRAKILLAVIDLCDITLRWFQQDTTGGRPCLIYRILDLGVMPNAAPDLALWYMPMFAWAYKMTGNQTYYDWAVNLAEAGIAEAGTYWGKHWNQSVIWAKDGFDYLFSEDEGMPVDIVALRALVDQLEQEATEAADAKVDLEAAQNTVVEAQDHLTDATTAYTTENDQRLAKLAEIIALLQAGMTE